MSAATMNEMERLRRERDDMAADMDRMQRGAVAASSEIAKVEAERDALAAHVERLASWIKDHGWHADTCGILDVDDEGRHMACTCGMSAINEAPTTSLARLIAEKQAEAMEGWMLQMRHMEGLNTHDCMESAELYAEELRRQSQESTNGHN